MGSKAAFAIGRVVWAFLVLLGVFAFLYQLYASVLLYLSWPVAVSVRLHHNNSIRFPAVTICNLNTFRLSAAASAKWYPFIEDLYTAERGTRLTKLLTKHEHFPPSMSELYMKTTQHKDHLIVKCEWGDKPCADVDVFMALTTDGSCFTFNGGDDQSTHTISRPGAKHGLRLLLNLEQYEYMAGPHEGAGVKVLLHAPEEPPLVHELGVSVPPGGHASIGTSLVQVRNLEPPLGQCDSSAKVDFTRIYSVPACLLNCRARTIQIACGCREFWMPSTDDLPLCDMYKHLACVRNITDEVAFTQLTCRCPLPCTQVVYDAVATHAQISNVFTNALLRTHDVSTMRERYIMAQETSERVSTETANENSALVINLSHSLSNLNRSLIAIKERLDTAKAFCDNLSKALKPRIDFHLEKALPGVEFVVHNNFVRGWEVIDESTVRHVTTEVYETINNYDRTIGTLRAINGDSMTKQMVYTITVRDLEAKLELAVRSIENTTTAYYRFRDAEPILSYQYTGCAVYDEALVPSALLSNLTTTYKSYYDNMSFYLSGYINEILSLKNVLEDTYHRRMINQTAYFRGKEQFVNKSKSINHYRFLFTSEIVQKSERLVKERIDQFAKLNHTLHTTISYVNMLLTVLQGSIYRGLTDIRDKFRPFSEKALTYLTNTTVTKTSIAELMTSRTLKNAMSFLPRLVSDVRTKQNEIREWFLRMRSAYLAIWASLINDQMTKGFYRALNRDLTVIKNEKKNNIIMELLRNITRLIGLTPADVRRDSDVLRRLVNADTVDMEYADKQEEINRLFEGVLNITDFNSVLTDEETSFIDVIESLAEELRQFTEANVVDDEFLRKNYVRLDVYMRDMSFEEIEQHQVYTFVQLLSDIGGSMGFLVGASALTIFELFDVCCHHAALNSRENKSSKRPRTRIEATDPQQTAKLTEKQNGRLFQTQSHDSFV